MERELTFQAIVDCSETDCQPWHNGHTTVVGAQCWSAQLADMFNNREQASAKTMN